MRNFLIYRPYPKETISKIEKQFREFGHVRQIEKGAAYAISDEIKFDVMLEIEENPHAMSSIHYIQGYPYIDRKHIKRK